MTETKPSHLWFNGAVVPWSEGKVHVWSELAIRGASVFEGIRLYWHERSRRHYALALDEHLERLFRSAHLLRLPTTMTTDSLEQAIWDLVAALDEPDHLYLRPTLYLEEGRYGFRADEVVTGTYVTGFPVPRADRDAGVRVLVSSWRRMPDNVLPPRIKAGGAYLAFRFPLIEARTRGFDDAILLNERDKVAEATGTAVVILRRGRAVTPPVTAGVLESITLSRVLRLLSDDLGIPVEEREVDRSELYDADEMFLCGTLAEIQPVLAVDDIELSGGQPGMVTKTLADLYGSTCLAGPDAPPGWLRAAPGGATP